MAALRAHVVLSITSLTLPSLSKLPCSLYIPSKSYEEKNALSPWALHVYHLFLSQNMDVPKMIFSLVLPYPFVVVSYVVSVMALGETFDADSRHSLEMPLVFPILHLCFGVLAISYPCAKMVELHHPGFLLSMVLRPKRFVTTISVIDITSKAHIFTFAPYGTVRDLRSQVNSKFKITSDLYWLSCRGKPLCDFLPLNEITGTVIMHGRLNGGIQCCLKGCQNEAGPRKFDSMIGQYEMKCIPEDITSDFEIVKNLRVCDKHYGTSMQRGKVLQNHAVMPSEVF